jgi:single-strand selective monofunctional uracil DNA glycosylase
MVQTGVPFGEVEAVRSWLGLRGVVGSRPMSTPKRPVEGLACTRSEVSGRRLWGWVAQRFVIPQRFARRFFVHNYCPLAFVADTGANLTPDKLPKRETEPLFRICDRLLHAGRRNAAPEARRRRRWVRRGAGAAVLGNAVRIGRMPHPSPASPAANQGWERSPTRRSGRSASRCLKRRAGRARRVGARSSRGPLLEAGRRPTQAAEVLLQRREQALARAHDADRHGAGRQAELLARVLVGHALAHAELETCR